MKTCSFCEMYDINQEINKHHSEFPTNFRAIAEIERGQYATDSISGANVRR